MAFIDIQKLNFSYPLAKQSVLNDIDLSIEAGEFVVICGTSGCGKSTLLKHLKREITPNGDTSGSILFEGIPLSELPERVATAGIGFVMQNPENQIVTDKVWHELAFGLENLGFDTMTIRRKVAEMANYFGIQSWFRKSTMELSGGQKQILNLAAIMAMQPNLLILDEPTSQLDPIAAREFISTIHKLNVDFGLTIILVEHRLEEVYPIADRVVIMDSGRIICNGTPRVVAQELQEISNVHPMLLGLPTPIRVHHALNSQSEVPLTIREGRQWLSKNFKENSTENNSKSVAIDKKPVLEVNDTWFRYEKDGNDILRGFSINVYPGEVMSILGGNGAGKTTALGVMSGLHTPYRGKVKVFDKPIRKYSNEELYHKCLAVLPQDPQTILVSKTVKLELETVVQTLKLSNEEAADEIHSIIHLLNLEYLLERHPYDLSGGEQQKVAFAKILLLHPRILLLDEPTKGLDAASKEVLADILKRLKAKDIAIVMVTHDIEFSASHSDRCALFFDGNIISIDETKTFYSGNHYYTTAAHRMSRHLFSNVITCEDVINRCNKQLKETIQS
ncbi:ATP-binding cassette domain-containing protein [Rummeliibacillus sp. TYF005]|uniref:ABC transporter ATP-binding protein n=1 Tax=Rummeliibacillus sp. TYF005 TaxID=2058214 RepID=UPI000F54097A|nr:ABC transporter ATP-binding protein [Rummeliibacillus sp. TYF005]RPJ96381.1 ATP-binding cassette domain-containing protein [Rummeliibacillus sp. TYF005]